MIPLDYNNPTIHKLDIRITQQANWILELKAEGLLNREISLRIKEVEISLVIHQVLIDIYSKL
jgi:hypothetical protein